MFTKLRFQQITLCEGCKLKNYSRHQVIGRGSIPARILFIGEAPGKTEDLLGEPFVGPSGHFLENMIKDACQIANITESPSYFITNTVLCRPWVYDKNDVNYGQNREPSKEEILACSKNILQIAKTVLPELVIFLGKTAETYYKKEFPVSVKLSHPAFHLRYGGKASPVYLQDIKILSEIFRRYL